MRMGLRQVIKKKDDGEGETLSLDFAERLRTPVEGEDALVAKLANSGASDEELDAAVGGLRLLESVGATTTTTVASVEKREPIAKSDAERERIAAESRRINERIQKAARERETTLATPKRTAAESLAEFEVIRKDNQIADDAKAGQRIEDSAVRLRKAQPSLSHAKAVVQVLKSDPTLYEAHVRHNLREQSRQMGYATDDPREVQKSERAWSTVEAAAVELRKSAPELTQAQAISRILKEQPTLYLEL